MMSMAPFWCAMERCPPVHVQGMCVCIVVEQQLNNVYMAPFQRAMERCPPVLILYTSLRAVLKEHLSNIYVFTLRCRM